MRLAISNVLPEAVSAGDAKVVPGPGDLQGECARVAHATFGFESRYKKGATQREPAVMAAGSAKDTLGTRRRGRVVPFPEG